MLAPRPFTIFVILPINHRLEAISADAPTPETRALLIRWGRLHVVRAALGFASVLVMFASLRGADEPHVWDRLLQK